MKAEVQATARSYIVSYKQEAVAYMLVKAKAVHFKFCSLAKTLAPGLQTVKPIMKKPEDFERAPAAQGYTGVALHS